MPHGTAGRIGDETSPAGVHRGDDPGLRASAEKTLAGAGKIEGLASGPDPRRECVRKATAREQAAFEHLGAVGEDLGVEWIHRETAS